ncbi:MAG: T9SS type A sorting domain-containing protein [Bacteroidales bacterium]|nr:T9SS type A sorting domain-containing protein [Bacteroidales bacterium]
MRKVLLLSLSLALGFSAFAQQRVAKNDSRATQMKAEKIAVGNEKINPAMANFAPQTAKSVVVNRYQDLEDGETMVTTYDLQSNTFCSNRMYELDNGSAAVVATFSHEPNQTATDRGTGYNFYNGSEWQEMPEARVEPNRMGWPTIAQWGDKGEILISHAPMHCWTRDIAGEGEWVDRGQLPASPEGYPYTDDASWPRVATSGPNHNIIHVVADIQHSISSDEVVHHQVYLRSEDAENWTISYGPIAEVGLETEFSAEDYVLAANGHTVAILYTGSLTQSVWMFKSLDDGITWTSTKVWEDPYEGSDWNDPNVWYEDTLFRPMNGAMVIDNNGVVHTAFNTFEMARLEGQDPGYYTSWSGRAVDGILYWNDTQDPIHDTDHEEYIGTIYEEHFATPHQAHAARLWWPIPDEPGYVRMHPDSTRWIGYIPMYENIAWDNDKFYNENDYHYRFYGASGHPALSCDPYGNLACAFSSPCTRRLDDNGTSYYRSIYVSYYNVDKGYWEQVVDDLTDEEVNFMFLYSDNLFTISAPNTYHPGEYWFGFQSDDQIGLYWGSYATQQNASDNTIHAIKINADAEYVSVPENYEAKDVVYSIYPNPATDYVVVKSSENVEANISIVNLVGQTVKQFNQSLKMGENTIGIDLKSGIYFCTISANGFNKTIKFVVK